MTLDTLKDVNWLAVLAGTVAYFVLGAIWHAPPVLGRVWQKASGVSMEGADGPSPTLFAINLVAYFVLATGTAMLAIATGTDTAAEGIMLGLVIGVAFSLTSTAVTALYERKPDPVTYFFVNGLYNTLGAVIVALIIGVWR